MGRRGLLLFLFAVPVWCVADTEPSAAELALMRAAVPKARTVVPQASRRVLVCSLVPTGYRHDAIPYGQALLQIMAEQTRAFSLVVSDELKHFEADALATFDVVFLNNANNELFLPLESGTGAVPPRWHSVRRRRPAVLHGAACAVNTILNL